MEFGSWLTWDVLSLGITGLVIMALGLWVFVLKPGDERHRAFGLYLFLYGGVDVQQAIPFTAARDINAMSMAVTCTLLAGVVALAWFILVYPRPRFTATRRQAVLVAVGVTAAALAVTALVLHDPGRTSQADGSLEVSAMRLPLTFVSAGALAFAPLIFAIDAARSSDGKERRALRLVAMACLVWPMYDLVYMGFRVADPMVVAFGAHWHVRGLWVRFAANALAVVAAAILLVDTRRHGERFAPLAVAILLGPAIAMTMEGLGQGIAIGLADLALPILVTIAILRGGLFGLDVKLRFAISKSTIAAMFIAVFFVASEVAQQFFGDRSGSTYIGIGIAGTLVFAMAPIQRAAEKLAETAVPIASPVTPTTTDASSRREESYREAVRLAMRDRTLTRDEEVHLHRLAEELGIGAGRAHELMVAVEGERTKGRRRA